MSEFNFQRAFENVHQRLDEIATQTTKTETHLHGLIGNGQPGRIGLIEADIKSLKEGRQWARGYFAAMGAVLTILGILGHYLVDIMRGK